jgi:DNA polymerase III gamma/tau subunit
LEAAAGLVSQGYDLSYFLRELREAFRQMLIEKCGYRDPESFSLLSQKLPAGKFSLEKLLRISQLLTKCSEQMRWNDSPRLVFETYAVRACQEALGAEAHGPRARRLHPVPAVAAWRLGVRPASTGHVLPAAADDPAHRAA